MRGCQRKIIMLKGTSSQIFDEAYFLLRKDFEGGEGDAEIVREAERLINLNSTIKRRKRITKRDIAFALLGGLVCAVVAAILALL